MSLSIVYRPLTELRGYERNARTHSAEQVAQIAASITEFGFTNPLLIGGDGTILAGHGRLAAALQLGMAEVPCLVLDHLTEAQIRAYIIADNKLALNAGWDLEVLADELAGLLEAGYQVPITGFSEMEVNKLLSLRDIFSDTPEAGSGSECEHLQMCPKCGFKYAEK